MDDLKKEFAESLRREIANAGSQTALAKKIGVQQSRISDYLTGRYDLTNMTLGPLSKCFAEMQIRFSADSSASAVEQELEKQVLALFRNLSPAEKARYVMLVSAHFGKDF